MSGAERRRTRRFKVSIPVRFNAAADNGQRANSINVSANGVCFATHQALRVGQKVELELRIPKRVTGTKPADRCFTGRVVHVKPNGASAGPVQVGVQFLYYEARRPNSNGRVHYSHHS